MNKRCIGCGAVLQDSDKDKNGYTPDLKNKYCMRCFRLTHYNDLKETNTNKDNSKIIDIINKKGKLVFFLIDFLNINNEVIDTYKSITVKKILCITKSDIIPKSIKENNVIDFINKYYKINDQIIFISSKSKVNNKKIINIMDTLYINNAYIVGYTNSGKSTLINSITSNNKITTSSIPNTTIDFINIKILDKVIVDSPGFIYKKDLFNKNNYKALVASNLINVRNYQTKDNMSLVLDDLILDGFTNDNSISCYVSNDIKIEKRFNKTYDNLVDLKVDDNSDIVIKSLGFFNVKKSCVLKITKDIYELVEVRPSIFGGCYE